jgi:hypothetical protein
MTVRGHDRDRPRKSQIAATVQVHNRAGALGALHLQRMHGHETLSYILVRGLFRPLGPAAAAVRHGHTHARHTPIEFNIFRSPIISHGYSPV